MPEQHPPEAGDEPGALRHRDERVDPPELRLAQSEAASQALRQLAVLLLELGEGNRLPGARARDLQVEVTAQYAARRDDDHRPEAQRHEPLDLEAAVQDYQQRPEHAEEDVRVEPAAERSRPAQEPRALAHGVQQHQQHHRGADDAELVADRAAGLPLPIALVAGPLDERRAVEVGPVRGDREHDGEAGRVEEEEPSTVARVGPLLRPRRGQRSPAARHQPRPDFIVCVLQTRRQ